MEFKGTKDKWHVLKIDLSDYKSISIGSPINNKVICHMTLGGSINNTDEYNALIISKAPEMLIELHETVIDLKILRNQIADASKTNHLFIGMPELMDNWIERKQQLIKEATEL